MRVCIEEANRSFPNNMPLKMDKDGICVHVSAKSGHCISIGNKNKLIDRDWSAAVMHDMKNDGKLARLFFIPINLFTDRNLKREIYR